VIRFLAGLLAYAVTPLSTTTRVYLERALMSYDIRLPRPCLQELADEAVRSEKLVAELSNGSWRGQLTTGLDVTASWVAHALGRLSMEDPPAQHVLNILRRHGVIRSNPDAPSGKLLLKRAIARHGVDSWKFTEPVLAAIGAVVERRADAGEPGLSREEIADMLAAIMVAQLTGARNVLADAAPPTIVAHVRGMLVTAGLVLPIPAAPPVRPGPG